MNKFLLFICILFSTSIFAQPLNDDCSGIIDLGVAPFCESTTVYNNVGATMSDIGNDNLPFCFVGDPSRDVWFSFVSSDTILNYTISIIGCPDLNSGATPIINPEFAIYRGDLCGFDELALLDCASADIPGSNEVELNPPALTPGITYYLRVNDWSATGLPNSGGFKVCVESEMPIVTIDQGSSTACSGEIYDSGGEFMNYGDNENHVFTICPTEDHACLNFALEFFDMEVDTEQLIFHDGPDINSPIIQVFGATNPFDLNGVTGGGSVCQNLTATSGCMTIQFTSNNEINSSGFHGTWQCSPEPCIDLEPIEVAGFINDDVIVNSIADAQMTVTIDTIICAETQYGVFEGDNNDLGLGEGLLLTTGSVENAFGPNNSASISQGVGTAGDADLNALSTITSMDACIVELDVFVPTDELTFEYIFGSDEYADYVGTNFNDIFAFLVSGPGITGDPAINNQENIAILPGSTTPVEINSVNHLTNWEYYRSNETMLGNPISAGGKSIQYDGMTSDFLGIKKSLTARKKVTPCNSYHLKLAIADRGDNAFDSGVFITEISGGTPTLAANYFSGISYLVEECTVVPDEIIVSIPLPENEPTTYNVTVGGSAQIDIDYTLDIPDVITFAPGETVFKFPIQAIADGTPEGVETIEISLNRDFGCGSFTYSTLVIELRDELSVEVNLDRDTAFICAGGDIQLEATGANQYIWIPSMIFDDNQVSNPTATPTGNMWVEVEGALGICFDKDSIWLEYRDPELDIVALGDTVFCEGNSVNLTAANNVQNTNLDWSPNTGINDDEAQNVIASPRIPTTYFATVELDGCSATDSIFIDVDPFEFPNIPSNDVTICQNTSVQLAEQLNGPTIYSWTPDSTLNNGNISGPIASPSSTTTYTFTATSPNDYCSQTAEVTVNVEPINVEILNPDSVFICLGESIDLNTETTSNGTGQTWLPDTYLTNIDNENVTVNPPFTITYTSQLEIGSCIHSDEVVVVVDSLPTQPIIAVPNKDGYCVGDTVTLISPSYNPVDFPNMMYNWTPSVGQISPSTNPNLIVVVDGPIMYTRENGNRECADSDNIELLLAADFDLMVEGNQTICPGADAIISASSPSDNIQYSWANATGGVIGTGEEIMVSPVVSSTYEVTAQDDSKCFTHTETVTVEVQATFVINNIEVQDPSGNNLDPSNVVKGQQIGLTANTDPTLSGATYEWFADGISFLTTTSANTGLFTVPDFEGDRTIVYTVLITDAFGCFAEANISVNFTGDFDPLIPNIFSPDGDNLNDRFKLITGNANNLIINSFKVFNRWGQLVYDNENGSEGWDGTHDGKPAPADVYIYQIDYQILGSPGAINATGEISLLR